MPRRRRRRSKGSQRKRKIPKITGGVADKEDSIDCVDRISNLPIDIIRQIHLCLPWRDAVRTSVLSHRWKTILVSHPIVHLKEKHFGFGFSDDSDTEEEDVEANNDEEKRNGFLTYLENSLDRGEYVDTIYLHMTVMNASEGSLVEKWIDFACRNKVKKLHIVILRMTYDKCFHLCNIAFIAATLVELVIHYCEISNCSFMLPNLRLLSLFDVSIADDDFKDLLAGCPRIEELKIGLCCGMLPSMVVSNPTLKLFALNSIHFDCKVLIESKNLESLEFISYFGKFTWEIEITSKTTVRNLKICGVSDRGRTLMHFVNQFPLLEKLKISGCSNLQNLYVSHRNLASLVLHLDDEVDVRIDAPKLKSLEYTGGLTLFPGIEASQELACVRFFLYPRRLNDRWYIWLRNILESFAHYEHLSLICWSEQAIIFPDELTEMLLPTINDLKHLELRIQSSSATSQQILDGFVWILPGLKTLSLTLGSITKFIEFPQ